MAIAGDTIRTTIFARSTVSRQGRWIASVLIAALLLMQFALAVYACPKLDSTAHMASMQKAGMDIENAVGMPSMPDCHAMAGTMDEQDPQLCRAHCNGDSLSSPSQQGLELQLIAALGGGQACGELVDPRTDHVLAARRAITAAQFADAAAGGRYRISREHLVSAVKQRQRLAASKLMKNKSSSLTSRNSRLATRRRRSIKRRNTPSNSTSCVTCRLRMPEPTGPTWVRTTY